MDLRKHRGRLLVAVGSAAALAAAPITTSQAATAAKSPDGVWQSVGYGSVIAIDNGKARTYELTSISCTPGAEYTRTGDRYTAPELQAFTIRVERDRAVQRVEGNVGTRGLRRLTELPSRCTTPAPTGPLAVFDTFWTTYAENYPFFRAKGVDWATVRAKYRPMVKEGMTDDQLFDVLTAMIRPLGDAHTGIRAPHRAFGGARPGTVIPDEAMEARIRPYIESTALQGAKLTTHANGLIGYAELPGGIGYLRPILFMGYADTSEYEVLKAELDRVVDAVLATRPRKLILDLRINGGGSDQLALDLAGRLTNRPYFAYFKRARIDPANEAVFSAPQPIFVEPSKRPRYTGPIVMLTSGSQLSAGETFTMALMNRRPAVVRVGQNTQGVFSDTLQRTLPNGWQFILPNEEYRTRDWTTYDGPGIPPHHVAPVFTEAELAAPRDTAFTTALRLLRGH